MHVALHKFTLRIFFPDGKLSPKWVYGLCNSNAIGRAALYAVSNQTGLSVLCRLLTVSESIIGKNTFPHRAIYLDPEWMHFLLPHTTFLMKIGMLLYLPTDVVWFSYMLAGNCHITHVIFRTSCFTQVIIDSQIIKQSRGALIRRFAQRRWLFFAKEWYHRTLIVLI